MWFTQACNSDRTARVLRDLQKPANKRKQVYSYWGGGQLSPLQTPLLTSVLVLTKTHDWLAIACVALYVIGTCGASGAAPWPRPDLMTVATEVHAGPADDEPADENVEAASEETAPSAE